MSNANQDINRLANGLESNPKIILERNFSEIPTCSPWIIHKSKLGGRGLFACQKIKKGSLIFSNKPLAIGPRLSECDGAFCSYCAKISDYWNYCEKCGLSVCGDVCKISDAHLTECEFITTNWIPKPNVIFNPKVSGRIRIYIQMLLLNRDQKELIRLLQHNNPTMFHELETLSSNFLIPNEQIEFMKTMHSVLKINSFRIPTNKRDKTLPLRGLFPIAAFLNHSCVPNTRNIFKKDKKMEVYASSDIDIGDEILSCYTNLLWCTPVRRYQLYLSKNFWCKCSRCSDPYEVGTMLSALKCFNKECVGLMLPQNPLNAISHWCCDACHTQIRASEINSVQSTIGSLVRLLWEENEINFDAVILKRLELFLPHCSHIFTNLHLKWALKLGHAEGMGLRGILKHFTLELMLCLLTGNSTNIKRHGYILNK